MSGASPRAEAKSRIPVTLVTGFLGSGKTTLINAALRSPELAKTVVVVNEFGEVGLDHKLFARSSDSVVVLENGCLCCTVRSDLIGTLNSLYHARQAGEIPAFDNVVIETSGLAEPGPVLQAFLVRANAGRALPGRERADARRRCQLARNVGRARRVGAASRAGRPDSHHQARSGRRRPAERRDAHPARPSPASTRQPKSQRSIGRRRSSPGCSRLRVSTRPTRKPIPGRG